MCGMSGGVIWTIKLVVTASGITKNTVQTETVIIAQNPWLIMIAVRIGRAQIDMRLIDADKLLDMLFGADLDYESMGGVNYCIDKIEEQPTAYDVEKVVEGLKGMSGIQFDGRNESYELNWCISTDMAIKIVKRGGKDE